MSVLQELKARGFIEATTHTEELEEYLNSSQGAFYVGFDPTGDSLHVGHLVCLMAMAHLQRAGHRPIALIGGGTGLIGDPSGKTELRKVLTQEDVDKNKAGIRKQLERFIDFSDGKASIMDNAQWLTELKYIPFLREIGRHFSVNRMIKAESYRARLEAEDGLTFIEFNYMLLQAYDFMVLARDHGCMIQMGGSDQWGNIVAGVDLIRRTLSKQGFGITFSLITTADGIKMGKTHKGAVWLDPERLSPYEYYQFWINTADDDVARFLRLFTFLGMDEIASVESLGGADLNAAKIILAYENTKIVHGKEEADKALQASAAMFGAVEIPESLLPGSTIPRGKISVDDAGAVPATKAAFSDVVGKWSVVEVLVNTKLCSSNSEARRLIEQGGAYLNGDRVEDVKALVQETHVEDGQILIRAGKKKHHKIILG